MATKEKHQKRSGYSHKNDRASMLWWFRESGRWAGIASGKRKAMKNGAV